MIKSTDSLPPLAPDAGDPLSLALAAKDTNAKSTRWATIVSHLYPPPTHTKSKLRSKVQLAPEDNAIRTEVVKVGSDRIEARLCNCDHFTPS